MEGREGECGGECAVADEEPGRFIGDDGRPGREMGEEGRAASRDLASGDPGRPQGLSCLGSGAKKPPQHLLWPTAKCRVENCGIRCRGRKGDELELGR